MQFFRCCHVQGPMANILTTTFEEERGLLEICVKSLDCEYLDGRRFIDWGRHVGRGERYQHMCFSLLKDLYN